MKKRVCDAHALIAYFEKEEGWEKVTDYFHEAGTSQTPILLSTVNYGEVYYITLRKAGSRKGQASDPIAAARNRGR